MHNADLRPQQYELQSEKDPDFHLLKIFTPILFNSLYLSGRMLVQSPLSFFEAYLVYMKCEFRADRLSIHRSGNPHAE